MESTPDSPRAPRPHLLPRLSRYSRAPSSGSLILLGGLSRASVLQPRVGAIASSRRHQQRLQLVCVQLGGQWHFQPLSEDLGIRQGLPTDPGAVVREGAPSQAWGLYIGLVCVHPWEEVWDSNTEC